MRHIDLSHMVEDGMITYKGLPPPRISDFLSREASRTRYAPGTEFQIGMIELCSNTGTYIDSPWHRYDGRADLAGLDLDRLADVDAVVMDAGTGRRSVDREFSGEDVAGKAVLVRTWGASGSTPSAVAGVRSRSPCHREPRKHPGAAWHRAAHG